MKRSHALAVLVSLLALGACQDKSAIEKAQDKVNDALDRRPHEDIQDAAEEMKDAAKELGDAAEDAANEAAEAAKEAGREAKAAVDEATQPD